MELGPECDLSTAELFARARMEVAAGDDGAVACLVALQERTTRLVLDTAESRMLGFGPQPACLTARPRRARSSRIADGGAGTQPIRRERRLAGMRIATFVAGLALVASSGCAVSQVGSGSPSLSPRDPVDGDADDTQTVVGEDPQRQEVRRLLNKNDITRSSERRATQIDRLGVAVADQQLLGKNRSAVASREEVGQH